MKDQRAQLTRIHHSPQSFTQSPRGPRCALDLLIWCHCLLYLGYTYCSETSLDERGLDGISEVNPGFLTGPFKGNVGNTDIQWLYNQNDCKNQSDTQLCG